MTKIIKLTVAWVIALIILFICFMITEHFHQKALNVARGELFVVYQDYMPLPRAGAKSIEASDFYNGIGEAKFALNNHYRLYFSEAASNDAEKARKYMVFFGGGLLILTGVGLVMLIIFLISGGMNSIRSKQIDDRYSKPSLAILLGVLIVGGVFSYRFLRERKDFFDATNKLYSISQYATDVVFKLIELGDIFYDVSVIEGSKKQADWLPKMGSARNVNESFLNELKSITRWDVPKGSYLPKYEDIVSPAIEISRKLEKYFDISIAAYSKMSEKKTSRMKGYVEFMEILEKLPGVLEGAVKYSGVSMRYAFGMKQFNKDALAKFQSIDSGTADAKHNLKLFFGYNVYRGIKKKAGMEETYEEKVEFLKKNGYDPSMDVGPPIRISAVPAPMPPSSGYSKKIAEDFLRSQPFGDAYEKEAYNVIEHQGYAEAYFRRKAPQGVKGDGLVRVDTKTWQAQWVGSE